MLSHSHKHTCMCVHTRQAGIFRHLVNTCQFLLRTFFSLWAPIDCSGVKCLVVQTFFVLRAPPDPPEAARAARAAPCTRAALELRMTQLLSEAPSGQSPVDSFHCICFFLEALRFHSAENLSGASDKRHTAASCFTEKPQPGRWRRPLLSCLAPEGLSTCFCSGMMTLTVKDEYIALKTTS